MEQFVILHSSNLNTYCHNFSISATLFQLLTPSSRIEFVSEKSRLTGGKKRAIHFENGDSSQEVISAPGFLKNELLVAVSQGMPNTSKPRRDVQKPGRKMVQNNNRNRACKLRYFIRYFYSWFSLRSMILSPAHSLQPTFNLFAHAQHGDPGDLYQPSSAVS